VQQNEDMLLTRAGVARRLGRSIATVRRMEGYELLPARDERGVHWFDPEEVTLLLEQRAVGNTPGTRGWLDARRVAGKPDGATVATAPRGKTSACRDCSEQALLVAIGERLAGAVASLPARELGRIPAALAEAIEDVLGVIGQDH
jgi:hypothetical protein